MCDVGNASIDLIFMYVNIVFLMMVSPIQGLVNQKTVFDIKKHVLISAKAIKKKMFMKMTHQN